MTHANFVVNRSPNLTTSSMRLTPPSPNANLAHAPVKNAAKKAKARHSTDEEESGSENDDEDSKNEDEDGEEEEEELTLGKNF